MTISCYSTALFATWYFIDEWRLLFDAGDGLTANLHQKAGKIKHVFLSHADRDHVTGLLQFYQLNARAGFPKFYYPKDSGSFPAMKAFFEKFDPHVSGGEWHPLEYGQCVTIRKDLQVRNFRNEHLPFPPSMVKSMGFHVEQRKRKLRPQYYGLAGEKIARLRQQKGDDAITTEITQNLLTYSGDTPVAEDNRFENTHTLIHEATFLRVDDTVLNKEAANRHSTLEGVLRMVADTNVQRLILGHFSLRYSLEEIDAEIRRLAKHFGIKIPIYRIPPAVFVKDVLKTSPIVN